MAELPNKEAVSSELPDRLNVERSLELAENQPITEKIYLPSVGDISKPIRQGEILSNVSQFRWNLEGVKRGESLADPVMHPFAIILSQDCDCEQDYKLRFGDPPSNGTLPSVLFCEVATAEDLKQTGNSQQLNSKIWSGIKQNKNERYQFLEEILAEDDVMKTGIPELTLDFKRYFTIPTDELYYRISKGEVQRRCRLNSPYLEHLAVRFGYFVYRIALPHDHASN